jgi:cytochrome c oxidase assembly protein subunit 15
LARYWFIGSQQRGSKLVLFAAAFAFIVILLGAYTRLTDAGLSCPDWPNCFGYLTAPHTAEQLKTAAENFPVTTINVRKAWTEMTHRYFAGTEGILILILAFSTLARSRNRAARMVSVFLLGLLILQVMLGMFTVTAKLKPVIVVSHLLTGISILCALWWLYLEQALQNLTASRRTSATLLPWLWLGVIIVFAQISLGGWVSSHYAGLACIDLPYCNGQLLPNMHWNQLDTDLITIHMLHRIGALVTAVYLFLLSLKLFTNTAYQPYALVFALLVILQLTLGILNVVWLRPIAIALMHQAVAILLLLTTLTAAVKAYIESREIRYAAWTA